MKNVEVHIFPGVLHGYMMPGSPNAFHQETRDFLDGVAHWRFWTGFGAVVCGPSAAAGILTVQIRGSGRFDLAVDGTFTRASPSSTTSPATVQVQVSRARRRPGSSSATDDLDPPYRRSLPAP